PRCCPRCTAALGPIPALPPGRTSSRFVSACLIPGPDVAGMPDPTRDAAFDLLTAVLDRRRPLEEALDALPPMAARDRAAAHRLVAATLRRLGTLDAVLEPFLKKSPPEPV